MPLNEFPSTAGRTIRLFLVDGRANGLIKAELINWSGVALSAPRSELSRLLRREELSRTGIYVLIGPDPDRALGQKVYIGEADNVSDRLRRHEASESLDFFSQVVAVVSKDENLTKAHARFLESRLIALTRKAGRLAIANATAPTFMLLPEADRADMAFFEAQMLLVLPILGFDLIRSEAGALIEAKEDRSPVFEYRPGEAVARARETEDGFVVMRGSTVRRETTQSLPEGYRVLRDQLIDDGRLVLKGEQLLEFTADVLFSSPSAAAAIIAGRNASGPASWAIPETGTTYKEWVAELSRQ